MIDNYCITCLKIGDKFTSDYVNKLYTMVRHQTDAPFFCFTDNPEGIIDGVNVVLIDVSEYLTWKNWWAAWYKLFLFVAPELKKFDRKYDKPNKDIQNQLPQIKPSILLPSRNGVAKFDNSVNNINK